MNLKKIKSSKLWFVALLASFFFSNVVIAQFNNIKNDQFWDTVSGKPIYSQGGGIFRFPDPKTGEEKYFWYGVHYKEAELYRDNPAITHERNNFIAVSCYSSTDLVNWTFENNVLLKEEVENNGRTGWLGRMGVAFIPEKEQYALFIQHNNSVLIALGDSPVGDFKKHNRLDMTDRIGTPNTGDQTVFTDYDTGKSYLVYSYGKGRHKIYISEIGVNKDGKVDLLDCTQVFKGKGREGNCMFKYQGKYYLYASNLYGWDSSYAYYLVSNNIKGPYEPTNKMLITPGCIDDFAHITQTGFFVNVKGTKQETVVYCGDRWADFAGNGLGYNQWVPMSFQEDIPYFNSLNSWKLNETTGEWKVAENNNYVKNPSFEADRRVIPSPVKPIQAHITGWVTHIYQGNTVVVGEDESPQLNYFNTTEDRQTVIGEKSLNIEDKVPFKRKVYQIIESTPFVELPNGIYNLSALIKTNSKFNKLEMYAESGGVQKRHSVEAENGIWTKFTLNNVEVKNGKVEIGFYADGKSNVSCQIDDVEFVKNSI